MRRFLTVAIAVVALVGTTVVATAATLHFGYQERPRWTAQRN